MKRMPWTAFFSVPRPDTGERKVMDRLASPLRTSAASCSAEMSQLRSRARLDSASCFMPAWASGPASFIACMPSTAIVYSRCADTSSGL